MEIILTILGLVIGCILMYFALRPKLTATQEYDHDLEEQNKKLAQEAKLLEAKIETLQGKALSASSEIHQLSLKVEGLKVQEEETQKRTDALQDRIDKDNELIFQKSFDLMQEKLAQAAQEESERYQKAAQEAEEEYLNTLQDFAVMSAVALAEKKEELAKVQQTLDTLRAKADAAIAAAKREEEKLLEIDKYKILVSELDLLEINRLREIAPYFRNARAIYKIIWESYYRNLTTEMINRVVGSGTHTGIYKLTNLTNQKTYVGQAANIGDRWKEHIKCGLGIDTPNNILYKAMIETGVENFTFEVLEECERSQLNDREKHYIAFYRSQEHGYNMNKGGARN